MTRLTETLDKIRKLTVELENTAKQQPLDEIHEQLIDYRATGKLIAAGRIGVIHGDRVLFVILVMRGDEYVVSCYWNTDREWISGRYFNRLDEAYKAFTEKLLELV